jgi:hypothetical protein
VVVEIDEICHSQKIFIGAKVKNWTNAKIRLSGGGARAKEEVQAASTLLIVLVRGFSTTIVSGLFLHFSARDISLYPTSRS